MLAIIKELHTCVAGQLRKPLVTHKDELVHHVNHDKIAVSEIGFLLEIGLDIPVRHSFLGKAIQVIEHKLPT